MAAGRRPASVAAEKVAAAEVVASPAARKTRFGRPAAGGLAIGVAAGARPARPAAAVPFLVEGCGFVADKGAAVLVVRRAAYPTPEVGPASVLCRTAVVDKAAATAHRAPVRAYVLARAAVTAVGRVGLVSWREVGSLAGTPAVAEGRGAAELDQDGGPAA